MLHSFAVMLLAIHSFLTVSVAARPWPTNATWANGTAPRHASSSLTNNTFAVVVERSVNATLSANVTLNDKRHLLPNQTVGTSLGHQSANISANSDLLARAAELFHIRRTLQGRKTSPWTNSTSHIQARRPVQLINFYNVTTRSLYNFTSSGPGSNFTTYSPLNLTTEAVGKSVHVRRNLSTNGTRWSNSTT
jgi:hypothetical protein